jgi:hypothetical protein
LRKAAYLCIEKYSTSEIERGAVVLHFHERVRSAAKMFTSVLVMTSCLTAGGGVYAQEQNQERETAQCACVTDRNGRKEGEAVGIVTSVNGRVNVMSSEGWVPAAVGSQVAIGGSVETGKASDASIRVGNCELKVEEQTQVTVDPRDGLLCIALAQTGGFSQAGLLAAGAIGIGAVVGLAVSTGDDHPASP